MGRINVLDQATINQIAAGEVVERPASVAKELVENAIDAGATAVTVEIKEGGISLLRVTDNGSGMEQDDIRTAFLRHATSKIKSALDLITVGSLGFRGEALSSICAVAQVELLTKTKDAFVGSRYVIEGGEEKVFEEAKQAYMESGSKINQKVKIEISIKQGDSLFVDDIKQMFQKYADCQNFEYQDIFYFFTENSKTV